VHISSTLFSQLSIYIDGWLTTVYIDRRLAKNKGIKGYVPLYHIIAGEQSLAVSRARDNALRVKSDAARKCPNYSHWLSPSIPAASCCNSGQEGGQRFNNQHRQVSNVVLHVTYRCLPVQCHRARVVFRRRQSRIACCATCSLEEAGSRDKDKGCSSRRWAVAVSTITCEMHVVALPSYPTCRASHRHCFYLELPTACALYHLCRPAMTTCDSDACCCRKLNLIDKSSITD